MSLNESNSPGDRSTYVRIAGTTPCTMALSEYPAKSAILRCANRSSLGTYVCSSRVSLLSDLGSFLDGVRPPWVRVLRRAAEDRPGARCRRRPGPARRGRCRRRSGRRGRASGTAPACRPLSGTGARPRGTASAPPASRSASRGRWRRRRGCSGTCRRGRPMSWRGRRRCRGRGRHRG